jgi:hypothetical protein
MRQLAVTVIASAVLIALPPWIAPATAAGHDEAVAPADGPVFHALGRLPGTVRDTLTPLTDEELASVAGAARRIAGVGAFAIDLDIIVQVNVCGVCRGVRQSNFAIAGRPVAGFARGVPRFPGR